MINRVTIPDETTGTPDSGTSSHLPRHTISQRFLITLAAQTSKSALSFLTGLVVARGLGPVEYGNLAFLLGSFAGLRLLLDMSTGSAFFTLAAQRPRNFKFFLLYAIWVATVEIGMPLLFIGLLMPQHVIDILWQSQSRDRVWLALIASALQYLIWPQIIQMGEVVRRTHVSQSLTIWISVSQFLLVVTLHLLGWLTLTVFLMTTTIAFLIGCILAFFLLPRPWRADAAAENINSIVGEFYAFCRPLALSYSFQAIQGWTEVWLLQHFAGPKQQGYYALGMQLSLIGLVATTALQNIFWREVAELEGAGDNARVHEAYLKTSRALLITAAAPVAFLIPWAPQIVNFALGERYHDAIPAVAILFLYPITQCLTTLAFVIFSVMRQTRVLAFFASCTAIFNIIGSYFVLAPTTASFPGLGAGALGMAVKIVGLAFVNLLFLEVWINRKRGWQHDWWYRLRLFFVLSAIGLAARLAGGTAALWIPISAAFVISGLSFCAFTCLVFYRWPQLAGMTAQMRDGYIGRARELLGRRV
jgi:O-antigen/teichoic acid export membrane protein